MKISVTSVYSCSNLICSHGWLGSHLTHRNGLGKICVHAHTYLLHTHMLKLLGNLAQKRRNIRQVKNLPHGPLTPQPLSPGGERGE